MKGNTGGLGLPGMMLLATAAALMVSAAAGGSLAPNLAGDGTPLPFDPPFPSERQDAARVALADPTVQDRLGERFAVTGVALRTDKPVDRGLPDTGRRLMDVWIYDYTADAVVWPVVDLSGARVIRIVDDVAPFQPPLAAGEIEHAAALAFEDPAVADRFPNGPHPPIAMLVHGNGTACPTNRCTVVAFVVDARPALDFLVLVNLSHDLVAKVIHDGDWEEIYRP